MGLICAIRLGFVLFLFSRDRVCRHHRLATNTANKDKQEISAVQLLHEADVSATFLRNSLFSKEATLYLSDGFIQKQFFQKKPPLIWVVSSSKFIAAVFTNGIPRMKTKPSCTNPSVCFLFPRPCKEWFAMMIVSMFRMLFCLTIIVAMMKKTECKAILSQQPRYGEEYNNYKLYTGTSRDSLPFFMQLSVIMHSKFVWLGVYVLLSTHTAQPMISLTTQQRDWRSNLLGNQRV